MKRVLFVCSGNRARSQMAEGLLRHLAGDGFQAHSAGTEAKGVPALDAFRAARDELLRQIEELLRERWAGPG